MFRFYNGYAEQHNYISSHLNQWYHEDIHVAIRHKKLIDRCFYSRSVEEIMENLRREVHPFAKECLDHMERNSMVSMQLAREMLHKAKNLDYTGCLEMEVNVALNRIRDTDFQLGVDKVIKTKTPFEDGVRQQRKNPGFKKKLS